MSFICPEIYELYLDRIKADVLCKSWKSVSLLRAFRLCENGVSRSLLLSHDSADANAYPVNEKIIKTFKK